MNQKLLSLIAVLFSLQMACGATFTVSTNADAGAGSLRQAIIDANALAGADQIDFTGSFSITLTTRLPDITGPVFINGPVVSGQPQIELNANTNNIAGIGILISASAGGSTLKGLNIHGHTGQEILVAGSSSDITIIGCYIGTNLAGTTTLGAGGTGIEVGANSSNILIGGATSDSSNIVSGNAIGILVAAGCSNVRIAGNRIGIGSAGAPAANTAQGIVITNTTGVTIGGYLPDEKNIIANNLGQGIELATCSDILVVGNTVGLGADGISVLPNTQHGILIVNSINVHIEKNLVSGNTLKAIELSNDQNITIWSNLIGSDKTGTIAKGNAAGISATNCSNIQIGGDYYKKNVICSNRGIPIQLNNVTNATIQYTFIGVDITGLLSRPNNGHGIQLDGTNTGIVIGGTRHVTGNIIAGGSAWCAGIDFEGNSAPGTIVKGNLIGTDSTGTKDFGNDLIGIILKSHDCIIGGTGVGEGNIIVGTKRYSGILVANANRNIICGNLIGVGADGITAIPNRYDGITICVEDAGQTANNNIVQYNTIAFNYKSGVSVGPRLDGVAPYIMERNNNIRFNTIYCNLEHGIFLNYGGIDKGNNAKAVPIIDFTTTTNAVINGTAASGDSIDLYEMIDCPDCENNPQGKRWIAAVQANLSGNWTYIHPVPVPSNTRIVATATDAAGNTSEFSGCCVARAGNVITPSTGSTTICLGTLFNLQYSNSGAGGLAGDSVLLESTLDGVTWTDVEAKQLAASLTFTNINISDTTTFRFVTFSGGNREPGGHQCSDTSDVSITMNVVFPPVAGTTNVSSPTACPGDVITVSLAGSSGTIQWQRSVAGASFVDLAGTTSTSFNQSPTAAQSPLAYRAIVSRGVCPADTSDTSSVVVVSVDPGIISGPQKQCDVLTADLTLLNSLGTIQWQDSTAGGVWTNIPAATSATLTYTFASPIGVYYVRAVVSDPTMTCPSEMADAFALASDTCPDSFPIKIPNAMTPNNDGNNDVFYIENINFYPNNHLIIFNRWGNKVYEANGYINEWDGKDLPDATYYYLLELGEDVNGLTLEKNKYEGNVTILK